jgi:hypothetical protein
MQDGLDPDIDVARHTCFNNGGEKCTYAAITVVPSYVQKMSFVYGSFKGASRHEDVSGLSIYQELECVEKKYVRYAKPIIQICFQPIPSQRNLPFWSANLSLSNSLPY